MKRIIYYKTLWKLLIDRGLNKVELQRVAGVSAAMVTKLAKTANNGKGAMIRL